MGTIDIITEILHRDSAVVQRNLNMYNILESTNYTLVDLNITFTHYGTVLFYGKQFSGSNDNYVNIYSKALISKYHEILEYYKNKYNKSAMYICDNCNDISFIHYKVRWLKVDHAEKLISMNHHSMRLMREYYLEYECKHMVYILRDHIFKGKFKDYKVGIYSFMNIGKTHIDKNCVLTEKDPI